MMGPQLFYRLVFLRFLGLVIASPSPQTHDAEKPKTNPYSSTASPNETYIRRWVSEPHGRGTFGILITCILTLFLCVWTTVHVNIEPIEYPEPWIPRGNISSKVKTFIKQLPKKRWVRKMKWGIVGLIFPELTVAIAAYERLTARLLRATWGCKYSKFESDESNKKICSGPGKKICPCDGFPSHYQLHRWGSERTLSYYAVMGGYQIIITDPSTKNQKPKVLTPLGVLIFAKLGYLPIVTPEHVRDKSKVNQIAKALVTFQALWMIIQVCARAALKKSVALLELHTVLHLVCAASMYFTWWDKPVDIEFPTEIHITLEKNGDHNKETGYIGNNGDDIVSETGPRRKDDDNIKPEIRLKGKSYETIRKEVLETAHEIKQKYEKINPTNPLSKKKIGDNEETIEDIAWVYDRAGLGKLMYDQLFFNEIEKKIMNPFKGDYFTILGHAYGRIIECKREIAKEGGVVTVVGLVYGGVHLATWNNYFNNDVERWMWRISSIIIAATIGGFVFQLWFGMLMILVIKKIDSNAVKQGNHKIRVEDIEKDAQTSTVGSSPNTANASKPVDEELSTNLEGKQPNTSQKAEKDSKFLRVLWAIYRWSCGFLFGVGVFVAIIARLFILVESFISLREVPRETYDSIPWVDAWTIIT